MSELNNVVITALSVLVSDVMFGVGVDTLVGVKIAAAMDLEFAVATFNVVDVLGGLRAGVMIDLEFVLPALLKGSKLFRLAAFSCWSMAILDCARALQVWMPSYHVWSRFVFPELPQFPNQEPPRPQQLIFPDFSMVPHLRHSGLMVVVVAASVYM